MLINTQCLTVWCTSFPHIYILGLSEAIAYSSGVSRRWETKVTCVQTFGLRFLFPIVACWTVKRCCEFLKLIAIHHTLNSINVAEEVLGCQGFWRSFRLPLDSCDLIYKLWTVGVGCSVGDSHLGWECRRPLVPDIEVTWLFSDFGVERIVDSSGMLSDLVYHV